MSAPPIKDASVYTDVRGLNSLKQAAKTQDPKAVREAARQFESLFTRMMLKSMREANFKDPNFGSDQSDFYQDMFDDQLAVQMSKGHGLGLADMMVQQMTRAGMLPAAAAKTAGTAPAAASGSAASAGAGTTAAAPAGAATSAGAAAAASVTAAPSATAPSPAADATASDSSPTAAQADFVKAMWPAAKAAGDALGVDPRNIIAQAALETGWGRAVPADSAGRTSFNLFGIKAGSQWTGASVGARTLEYSGGLPTARTDKFRAYFSTDESFQDYVGLLRGNSRYSAALNTGSDTKAFATALQNGGYSTDPAYASKLTAIAQNLDTSTTGLKSADARSINPSATIL
ncbi:MAG TPA: flagellar assembly peptidoglycan hydrolase FlgJ [Steroidobacteraceae bacterium]|jgi:flagellar protein FlgJ